MKKMLLLLVTICVTGFVFGQTDEQRQAMDLVRKNQSSIGLSDADISNAIVSDTYVNKTSGTRLVYLQQTYLGIPVYNQIHVLSFKNGKLVYQSGGRISSMDKKVNNRDGVPSIYAETAVHAALADRKLFPTKAAMVSRSEVNGHFIEFNDMGVSREPITARLMWVPTDDHSVKLAWLVYVIPVTSSDYWMIRVDAGNKRILGMDNYTVYCNWDAPHTGCDKPHQTQAKTSNLFQSASTSVKQQNAGSSPFVVNNATYRVVPHPAESPIHTGGTPALVTNPWNNAPGNATSLKWHSDGTTDYNYTRGNNVWAKEDRTGNNSASGLPATSTTTADPLSFDFAPNFTVAPTQISPVTNQQFNITNLFYWNNIIHDITYQYGFDEVAGNFQANNQGRGGAGNDYVLADAQDGGGTNNANFATPSDGGNGRMQMYLWSGTPQKDGDADNGIISHEFAHGISNRLTGGPSQAGCLQNAEQMGEGWSDYYGLMYTQDWANSTLATGNNSPRGIGTYVIGQPQTGLGIRSQRYSTNFNVNNKVYAASISAQQHNRGEIWCAVLWDMTWNIINQVGSINPNIYDANGGGGNTIALKLVTEGLKLQPCSPGFIDGRNAILAADSILYNGAYSCAIREAFRRRGMGAFASQGSSSSVTDQVADYTAGNMKLRLTQGGVTAVPEGQNITYTNTIENGPCAAISNYVLTDTLPSNVTYVSGGNYNATNRVVSFPVDLAAGQTGTYTFVVRINNGAYFPTVTLFEDQANTNTIPASMTTTSTTAINWVSSTARSFSVPRSYYSFNQDVQSDQRLITTNAIALGATPPPLYFRHWYSTEGTYDGGVLEISTDGGNIWTDARTNIIKGGYTGTMDASTLLAGRQAWTGSSNGEFMRTVVNLAPYANQSIKFRFRFTSDVGTNLEGWYVDDIYIRSEPVVDMTSNLFNASNVRVLISDTTTLILPPNTCNSAAVTTPPANVSVCSGSNASFTVAASGSNLAYQWQVSTDGGNTWSNISGANSNTLTLTGVTTASNNNRYRVLLSNTCPSNATSEAAILTVSDPAGIAAQPADLNVCAGSNGSFSVTASGAATGYQWQVSTDGGATWSNISGATTSTLSLSAISNSSNNYKYRVIISSCDPNGITSNAVTLTVNSPAVIGTQPLNQTGCTGSSVTFSSGATGTGISYQWQVSTNGGSAFNDIPGETGSSLTLTGITSSMNQNQYQVVVNSSACPGAVNSSAATLIVTDPTSILAQPGNLTVCAGSNGSFTVNATGSGNTYQWQVSTDGGTTWTNISGANTATLSLSAITGTSNNNQYRVVISTCDPNGLTSNAAILTVNSPASIGTQPISQSACTGSNISFNSSASGTGISYQWQVSTDGGNTWTDINGETNPSLNLTGVSTAMNQNQYHVIVTGSACPGSVTSSAATLTVSDAASITGQPASVGLCPGNNAVFTVTASGNGISYQWQVSTDGGNTWTDISGATGNIYTLNAVTPAQHNNLYRVIVFNSCSSTGVISSTAILTVENQAGITQQPASQAGCINSAVTFSFTANANTQAIQWQVSTDGGNTWTDIPGANNASFAIPSVTESMNGTRYRVVVSNSTCASVTSNSVTLTVNPDPVVTITANPYTQLYNGLTTTLTATSNPPASSFTWFRNGTPVIGATGNSLVVNYDGIGSYTVAVNDINGCSNTSGILAITDSVITNNTFLFPNPNNGQFFVRDLSVGLISSARLVTIYDSKGARVFQKKYTVSGTNSLIEVFVKKLSGGTYVLVLTDNEGKIIGTGKFIKN